MEIYFSPLLLCIISVLLSCSLSLLLYQHDLGVSLFEMLVALMGEESLPRIIVCILVNGCAYMAQDNLMLEC